MMFEIHRAQFLKASELLQELMVLQQIKSGNPFSRGPLATGGPNDAMLQSQVTRLQERGFVDCRLADGERILELNAAGEQQLRVLTVDYMRELVLLHSEMIEFFRKKLAEFYLRGVRRVAFYPVGDTAEVVYLALQSSGISVGLAVDDDPLLWGANFHEVPIKAPSSLADADIDGIILTTSVFETAIRSRIAATGAVKAKLLSLW